jgi:pimeloyl-ACP methyl ester carboxylesterase
MSTPLATLAALLTLLALYLPTRAQAFTRVIVDGRSIRMLMTGSGASTVVFENGLGGPLELWGKVQPEVSRFAKTVSYDRAGVGLSDTGPLPRDGARIATELRRALQAADIAPPYILVGASLGGPYIRIFAGLYPNDVAGLVLVDPTSDAEPDATARPGLRELEALPATLGQARASRVPGAIPVFLIDAVSPLELPFATDAIRAIRMNNRPVLDAESRAYQQWLDTIPGSQLIVTNRSGHNVAQEQPELVVETILKALNDVP